MQVEELMRSHPNLGEFIATTKAEALELTKELEVHIKEGYFEIVKAADQLLHLSTSLKSARQLLSPLPCLSPSPALPQPAVTSPTDTIWLHIDSNSLGQACKECVTQLTISPTEEMKDLFEYLQSRCSPRLLEDSEELVASKLAGWGVLREYHQGHGEIGEELVSRFAQQLGTEINEITLHFHFPDIDKLSQLLCKSQNHFEFCFLKDNLQREILALGLISTCNVPKDASNHLKTALNPILPTLTAKITAVIEAVSEPKQTLSLRFSTESRFGIISLSEIIGDLWVKQLQKCALQRLNEFKFLENVGNKSAKEIIEEYESENGDLLESLVTITALEEAKNALISVIEGHLSALADELMRISLQTDSKSSLILTLAFFIYQLQRNSRNLKEISRELGVDERNRHMEMMDLWGKRVKEGEMLSVLREVRAVCGEEVGFCEETLRMNGGTPLTAEKKGIAEVFGLEVTEEPTAETPTCPGPLPALPSLQLLPRFLPHLIYS